jgi:hypothetical protein
MAIKNIRATGLVGLLLVLALAAPGSGIGLPTLVSITIDGDMSDWAPVLANPVNVTSDGDGSSYGKDCIGSTDLDCQVKGGTGRDLLTFAWTYDSNDIFLLIERWGSSSNIIRFFFVMDLDGNGYAEASDVVLLVEWSGVKAVFNATLCAYIPDPAGSGSDSLVDPSTGFADGWKVPGSIDPASPLATYTDVPGGEASTGLRFEASIPWADLGLTGPTPVNFHVASHNNTTLSGAEDNMGGPDGGLGQFGYTGVDIFPAWIESVGPGDLVALPHTISNQGNLGGVLDLTGSSSLGLSLTYYADPDGDGIGNDLMAVDHNGDGDFADGGDTAPAAAYDTNGNGKLDFSIPVGAHDYFVVEVQVPPFLNAVTDYLDFQVKLDSLILVGDQVEDRLYIGYFTVYPDRQASAVPGQYVDYGYGVTNNQSFTDTADLSVLSSRGWDVALFSDPDGDGDPIDGVELARDLGGNGTWDSGDPDTGPLAPAGGTVGYVIRVFVPATAVPGIDVDVTTLTATSVLNVNRAGTAMDVTTVMQRVTVEPDYTFADGTNLYGSAGSPVYFPFRVINSWTTGDSFSLSVISAQGWPVVLWSDLNGNGSIDDGSVIANTGLVPAMGGEFNLVAEVQVPATALGGDQDTLTVTATSDLEPTQSDSAVGQLEIHLLQTFRDSLYLLQARHFAPCEIIYTRAMGLAPGEAMRYKLRYRDSGMALLHEDDLVTNARGFADASRAIAAGEPLGAWTLEIWDTDSLSVLDFITIDHERAGTVGPVVISPDPAAAGNDLRVSAVFTNTNSSAPYSQTAVTTWVRAPDGSVLQDDGTFVPDTGVEVTQGSTVLPLGAGDSSVDIFTITNVAFPMIGVYTVDIRWDTGCGDVIAALTPSASFQVDADTDLDGVPDSIDICPAVYNPMQDLLADPLACGQCDIACDDLVACTDDSCQVGVCGNAPNDLNCPDDGLFCNGTEYCDAANDCDSTGDPCAAMGQICDEIDDTCGCAVDADCNDAVGCTDDTCVAGACVYTQNDAHCPDDGLYCNGSESCDAILDCVSSGDPCALDLYCNDETDACDQCRLDSHCNDSVGCTDDTCVSGSCTYTPNDSNCADDGLYCTGLEICDAVSGCVSTGDPCAAGGQICDEPADGCVDCLVDADCSDGVACTDDACVGGSCVFTADDANCMDDGLYCNGVEYCDAAGGCLSGGDPCVAAGMICDEVNDGCVGCLVDADCTDGVACTDDTCVAEACIYTPNDANCIDDGLYCNGTEYCDAIGGCLSGGDPCVAAGQICNETSDSCDDCLVNADCDDGFFCNGAEVCSGGLCIPGGDPCPDRVCNEARDECMTCTEDSDCDDGFFCNGTEVCVAGVCFGGQDPCAGQGCDETGDVCTQCVADLDCDDGLFCTGAETCSDGLCQAGGDPCAGRLCDEAGDLCTDCTQDAECDDGLYCTGEETCDTVAGTCAAGTDPCPGKVCNDDTDACDDCTEDVDCDDGWYCTGEETCDTGSCVAGTDPCAGLTCDDDLDVCTNCQADADCDDGLFCNGAEACAAGRCWAGPDPCLAQVCDEAGDSCRGCTADFECNDGEYCNGAETCVAGTCRAGADPCSGQVCDEGNDECLACLVDEDCDDGIFCNGAETCIGGMCRRADDPCPGQICDEANDQCRACAQDADCDDNLYCNGTETCSAGTCHVGTDPCPGRVCDEGGDVCEGCLADSDCDDGRWCNGAETCQAGECRPGSNPCPGQGCDEDNDACFACQIDLDCDDGLYCNGPETCDAGSCMPGEDPCPDQMCDEVNDRCVAGCPDADDDGVCDDDDPCPTDAKDLCTMWDESDVRGGGCQCGVPGTSGGGLLLLLLLGLAALRLRHRVY